MHEQARGKKVEGKEWRLALQGCFPVIIRVPLPTLPINEADKPVWDVEPVIGGATKDKMLVLKLYGFKVPTSEQSSHPILTHSFLHSPKPQVPGNC